MGGNWKAPLAARREQRRLAGRFLGTALRVRTMKHPAGSSPVEYSVGAVDVAQMLDLMLHAVDRLEEEHGGRLMGVGMWWLGGWGNSVVAGSLSADWLCMVCNVALGCQEAAGRQSSETRAYG